LDTLVSPAKTAESIDGPFRVWPEFGAHWRHLVNALEGTMRGDAVLYKITLTTCCYYRRFCATM